MEHDNELKHYGVPGMKWGVIRARKAASGGDSEKASRLYSKHFTKSVNKAKKLNQKSVETNFKSAKLRKKALTKETKATNEKQYQKARKIQFKANKLQLKSVKLQKKAMKWEKKMEKTFSEVNIKDVNKDALDAGKKYAYMLMQD